MGSKQQTSGHRNNARGPSGPQMGAWESLRFTWRMLRDPRVAPYAKVLLPILAFVYLVSPIDLIPDVILGLGQVDDLGVMAFVGYLLLAYVKRAGWATLLEDGPDRGSSGEASKTATSSASEDIIDAQFRIISRPRDHRGSRVG
ncbi:MAG: YkvA family protein [Thermomicrobiales bacterium]